jgi:hypothetical protein
VSWQVNAFVDATPTSIPASVCATTVLSRAMVEVETLTTVRMCWPFDLA